MTRRQASSGSPRVGSQQLDAEITQAALDRIEE